MELSECLKFPISNLFDEVVSSPVLSVSEVEKLQFPITYLSTDIHILGLVWRSSR